MSSNSGSDSEMMQYLGVFLDEAHEQLDLFEAGVIELERSPDPDAELQTLFRSAHTLKGSSRAMGYLLIGNLTHQMETVLAALRSHELGLTSHVIDTLLDSLDALKELIASVSAAGNESQVSADRVDGLVSALNEHCEHAGGATTRDAQEVSPETPVDEPIDTVSNGTRIRIELTDDCPMKSIRAALILGSIERFGTVLGTNPPAEALEAEKFDSGFDVFINLDEPPTAVEEAVRQLGDVKSVRIVADEAEEHQAAPTSNAQAVAKQAPTNSASSTVRVDVARLDKLLNLVGELVTDRMQLENLTSTLVGKYPWEESLASLSEGVHRFGRTTSELQEEIMKSRMLPINGIFQRMPRMVRDLAQNTGKQIEFETTGGETEVDRSVLEILGDPIIHLLRNAVDHGVEPPDDRKKSGKPKAGKVVLAARQEGSQIVVEVSDDGRGIDPEKIREAAVRKGVLSESAAESVSDRDALYLVFTPGFSTAKELSDISGRGVGMDIVRSNIEKANGRIEIESKQGEGTRFLIYLPLTLAIVRAVLVASEGTTFALPLTAVKEMISLDPADENLTRCSVAGQAAIVLRGQTMPLANFADLLRNDQSAVEDNRVKANGYAIVVRNGHVQTALSVDELQGEHEIVIKPVGSSLSDIPGISGASILGDGRVALVVDPSKAFESMRRNQQRAYEGSEAKAA